MANWGAFTWGDGTYWGQEGATPPTPNGELVWTVLIDWTNTGFSGTNEAAIGHLVDCVIERGTEYYVRNDGTGIESMRVGSVSLEFEDNERRYDPYNTASPLYPNVLPGRPIQVAVTIWSTNTKYVLFTGTITDIRPTTSDRRVRITAEDGLRFLANANINTEAIYTDTISSAILRTLTLGKWMGQKFIIYSAQPLQIFEPDEGDALSIINELAEANLGAFFINKDGKATFYPYNYAGMTTDTLDQSELLRRIQLPQPWDTVRNDIAVIANRRGKRPSAAIWQNGSVDELEAGEEESYGANYKKSVNVSSVEVTANTAADGSGTDVSDLFSAHLHSVTTTNCTVDVKNNSGQTAYLTSLRVIGREIAVSPVTSRSSDATSITLYGNRRFRLDNPWLEDKNYATAFAGWLKTFLKDAQKNPVVQIQQLPAKQYGWDLLDKATVTSAAIGINDTFSVNGIRHEWLADTGQSVLTTLWLCKRLYSATVPTPSPYRPGVDPLPDVPPPYWPPSWPPYYPPPIPPDTTLTCLLDPSAASNGPVTLNLNYTNLISDGSGNLSGAAYYPCGVRMGSATYKTIVKVYGHIEVYVNSEWQAARGDTGVVITGFGASGGDLVTASIESFYPDDYTPLIATFEPTAGVSVSGFKIALSSSTDYAAGDTLVTGSINVKSNGAEPGVTTISNLTPSELYAIEATGGPWYPYADNTAASYRIMIRNNASTGELENFTDLGGDQASGYYEAPVPDPAVNGILDIVHHVGTGGHYARCFYIQAVNHLDIIVNDSSFADNHGAIFYKLCAAGYTNQMRWNITRVTVQNVCPA